MLKIPKISKQFWDEADWAGGYSYGYRWALEDFYKKNWPWGAGLEPDALRAGYSAGMMHVSFALCLERNQ